MNIFILIELLILLPVLSGVLVLFIKNFLFRSIMLFIIALSGTVLISFILFFYINYNILIENYNVMEFSNKIYLSLQIEPFTLLFATLISVIWPLAIVYTFNYMNNYNKNHNALDKRSFYCFLSLSIACALGIAFSGNLITTFIFYELLTLVTYPLVTYKQTPQAKKAGKFYIGILIGTSTCLFLPAIILVWNYTYSLDYTLSGLFFSSSNKITALIFLMFLYGVSKAALFPFHAWLPKAMVAPSPVSALLHGVTVVKSGVFILIKIVIYIFGIDSLSNVIHNLVGFNAFLLIPLITIVFASVINLVQTNFKRLLAYSTIGQLSYILFCILLFNKIGIIAAAVYFVAHALAKVVLFFQAGCYLSASGKENIKDLSGIGKRYNLPITTTVSSFSMFSILNLPFTLGFIAKFYLIETVIASNEYWTLLIFSLSYVCTVVYFSSALYYFYFAHNNITLQVNTKIAAEDPIAYMLLVIIFITMLNLLLFFSYSNIVDLVTPITVGIK